MGKKRASPKPAPPAAEDRASVTAERFARLHRLLTLLSRAPQPRDALVRRLKLDVRGFYRDLEVLRQAGVTVVLSGGKYQLVEGLTQAQKRLPFPDPLLTVGEALQLARGRTAAHKRLKQLVERRLA
jgi:predicted DNA-binding transcriptional regulator YafY